MGRDPDNNQITVPIFEKFTKTKAYEDCLEKNPTAGQLSKRFIANFNFLTFYKLAQITTPAEFWFLVYLATYDSQVRYRMDQDLKDEEKARKNPNCAREVAYAVVYNKTVEQYAALFNISYKTMVRTIKNLKERLWLVKLKQATDLPSYFFEEGGDSEYVLNVVKILDDLYEYICQEEIINPPIDLGYDYNDNGVYDGYEGDEEDDNEDEES